MTQKVEVPKFVELFDKGRHTKKSLGGHWFAGTNTCQRCGLTKQQLAKLLQKEAKR